MTTLNQADTIPFESIDVMLEMGLITEEQATSTRESYNAKESLINSITSADSNTCSYIGTRPYGTAYTNQILPRFSDYYFHYLLDENGDSDDYNQTEYNQFSEVNEHGFINIFLTVESFNIERVLIGYELENGECYIINAVSETILETQQ